MKDPRDESIPYWLQMAMPSGSNGGILGSLAEPVVEPRNDPRPGTYAEAPWVPPRPLYPFVLPATFSPTQPLEHLDSGKYWPVASATSGAQSSSPASWAAPMTPLEQLASAMAAWGGEPSVAKPKPSPVTAAGLAKQGSVGLGKGLIGLPGIVGDARDIGFNIGDWISEKIRDRRTLTDQQRLEQAHGADFTPGAAERQKQQRRVEARRSLFATNPFVALAPSSSDIQGAVEQFTGPFRKPENVAEEYADTAGQFVPALFGGPGGWARRGAQWLAPALASETAGQVTKGTGWEPAARFAGAILGGAAPYLWHPSAPRGAPAPARPVAELPPRPAVAVDVPVAAPGVPERVPSYALYEAVPGVGTGQFPKLNARPASAVEAAEADRLRTAYSLDPRSGWDYKGRDVPYGVVGFTPGETRRVQGAYVAPSKPPNEPLVELSDAWATRPVVRRNSPFDLSPESKKTLDTVERFRSTVDMQNRGNWLVEVEPRVRSEINALKVPFGKPLNREQMDPIARQADAHGLFVADTGAGLVLMPKEPNALLHNPNALTNGKLGQTIRDTLGVEPKHAKFIPGDIGNEATLAAHNQGSGLATEKLLEFFRTAPEVREMLERSRLIREIITAHLARDRDWSKSIGDATRPDAERLLKTLTDIENWERGLAQALRRHRDKLPAAVPPLAAGAGAYEADSSRE